LKSEVVLSNEAALPLPFSSPRQPDNEQASPGGAVAPLASAAREGDDAAFAELYRTHARMVHGLLVARVPRRDVDDLVQEVFLAAWRRIGSLRDPAAFPGWLAAIARHQAIDHLRQRAADTVELPDDVPDRSGDKDPARVVLDAIRALPDAYRDTLVLRLVEGMTGPEIAARTGLTEGSVRVNLHRGMKLLRIRLHGPPPRKGAAGTVDAEAGEVL
jgi:RNA polymerase sigma-70 factor (ECF subfamily)